MAKISFHNRYSFHVPIDDIDINECETRNGDCEQECVNTGGSYGCSCRAGYFLAMDNMTCSGKLICLMFPTTLSELPTSLSVM